MTDELPLPPKISRDAAADLAETLEGLLARLRALVSAPSGRGWGMEAADIGVDLVSLGTVLADSGVAVAALEGHSIRAIADRLGIANSALPRRLAGTPELGDYAEETKSGVRVSQGAIERARYDLRHGTYTVEGEPERVQRRRR